MMGAPHQGGLARTVLRDPVHWLAFGFGAGLLPWAPGTWGSLLAVLLFWTLPPLPVGLLLAGAGLLFLLGIPICRLSAARLGVHDHGGIVFDEMVAMLALLAVTPRGPGWWLAAFLLFRAADILKPWPIRELDHRLRGGLGIMLDDVLAAGYAALAVHALALLPLP